MVLISHKNNNHLTKNVKLNFLQNCFLKRKMHFLKKSLCNWFIAGKTYLNFYRPSLKRSFAGEYIRKEYIFFQIRHTQECELEWEKKKRFPPLARNIEQTLNGRLGHPSAAASAFSIHCQSHQMLFIWIYFKFLSFWTHARFLLGFSVHCWLLSKRNQCICSVNKRGKERTPSSVRCPRASWHDHTKLRLSSSRAMQCHPLFAFYRFWDSFLKDLMYSARLKCLMDGIDLLAFQTAHRLTFRVFFLLC